MNVPNYYTSYYHKKKYGDSPLIINFAKNDLGEFIMDFCAYAKQNGFNEAKADKIFYIGLYFKESTRKYLITNKKDLQQMILETCEGEERYIQCWAEIKALIIGYYSKAKNNKIIYNRVLYHHYSDDGTIKISDCF